MTTADKIKKLVEKESVKVELCFAVPGSDTIIDTMHPKTGRSVYADETLDQIRVRYPGAEIMSLDDFCKAKAARQEGPIQWHPTTQEVFDEMLGCLPPACMRGGFFLVGEPWDHHAMTGEPRYDGFGQNEKGEYIASNRPMTVREFKARIWSC